MTQVAFLQRPTGACKSVPSEQIEQVCSEICLSNTIFFLKVFYSVWVEDPLKISGSGSQKKCRRSSSELSL